MASDWTGRGKVRAREIVGGAEIAIDGITTQVPEALEENVHFSMAEAVTPGMGNHAQTAGPLDP